MNQQTFKMKTKPQYLFVVTSEIIIKEELQDLAELKDMAHGVDIKETLDILLINTTTLFSKLRKVAIDSAMLQWQEIHYVMD